MADMNVILIGVAVLVALAVLFLLTRSKKGAGKPDAGGHGVTDGAAAAIEDVAGDILGVDARPQIVTPPAGPADELTLIKGLGPKIAARLNELGITRFDQIAAWDEGAVSAMEGQLGTFADRIKRDKWVEQASFLARGDKTGFEAKFGKLGV